MFINHLNFFFWEIPWWSSGSDFTFSLPGAWVQSLVEELRSHKPHDMAKKNSFSESFLFIQCSCFSNGLSYFFIRALHSSVGKESACDARDPGLIPGLGRSTGEGIGYPLQCSWTSRCLSW